MTYSELMGYTALAYSYWLVFTTRIDVKTTPTNFTDYSCYVRAIELIYPSCSQSHRTYLTNHMGSISHHIIPLVINSLGRGHTHTQTRIHIQTSAPKKTGMCLV